MDINREQLEQVSIKNLRKIYAHYYGIKGYNRTKEELIDGIMEAITGVSVAPVKEGKQELPPASVRVRRIQESNQ